MQNMATVESPECSKTQSFSLNNMEHVDMLHSMDLPVSMDTETPAEQMSETATEPKVESLALGQKLGASADRGAFTTRADDVDLSVADNTTGNLSRTDEDVMGENACDNKVLGREQPSLDLDERELPGENRCSSQDLTPVAESAEGGDRETSVTSEVNEPEMSNSQNSIEEESTAMETSVEQKEQVDGKNQEEANITEEVSKQPKKRRMVCKECGKVFNRRETFNLHRHFHLHEDELKPLTCKECGLTFQQRSSFIKHRNEHKENGNKSMSARKVVVRDQEQGAFKCAECATVFFSLNKLRNHRCTCSDEVPFHCPICRQDFMYKVAITKHMFTHSKERLQCAECDQTFSDRTSLRTHQHSHGFHKPYECPDCGKAFKQYSLMVDHRRKHTENSASFPCNVCGKSFKYVGLLQQHQYLHTGKKPFCCSECGKAFAFAQNLKAHYRQHSLNVTSTSTEKPKVNHCNSGPTAVKRSEKENMLQNKDVVRTYKCPLCDQNYTTPANLRNHMYTHEAEYDLTEGPSKSSKEDLTMKLDKAHNCPYCPNVYTDKLSLNVHVSSAHKLDAPDNTLAQPQSVDNTPENVDRIRPFKCHECGKSFRYPSLLEIHKRIHSKEKPYQCKVCGKSFSLSSYLQQHLIIHTNKRPYKCPDCGKDFALLHNMKSHQKLHQEKPFRCNHCPKGYSDETQLQRHILSHNGDKPHKCSICDKKFGLVCQLRDHMNTHTGDRPHHCEECNKSFTWLTSLLIHQKNAHKRRNTAHLNSFPLGDRSDSSNDLRGSTLGLSRSFAGSDMVGLSVSSDTVARDTELNQMSDQPPPMNAVGIDLKSQSKPVLSELQPPIQWKVDGNEVMPVPSAPQTYAASKPFENPSVSRPTPGQTVETSHMIESSLSNVCSSPTAVPKKASPSSAPEIEQKRQVKPFSWNSPPAILSTGSLHNEYTHSGTYVDGAALWSVRPTTPNTSSASTSKKPTHEVQFTAWQGAPLPPQTGLSPSPRKDEGQTWEIGNSHAQTITQSEKPWSSSIQNAPTLAQMASHGIGARWDIQTSPGLQQTLTTPDRLVTNADFHLQQKQMSPNWASVQSQTTAPNVPLSIQFDPLRFGQALGASVWAFQSNPVGPQALLKPGTIPELQHQQPMATGTKIILNQPPPFFPLPPMTIPPPHPLHSVAVGALPRPPHPNLFFPPQAVTQTLSLPQHPAQRESHKLAARLTFPTDRLHQCMICGCSLPRELDLQMHYMQHAQGKI